MEEGADSMPQFVSAGPTLATANVPQILTGGNLSGGQVYVIGSPGEVFASQAGTRAIAPRSSPMEGTTTAPSYFKKVSFCAV